jgi:signal transduction histidine kinase
MMILMLKPDPMVVDRMALTERRLMGLSGIFAVGIIAIVAWIVARSLKPLTDFSQWIASSQNHPYPVQRLPQDLKQSAQVWNATLAQFSAVKQQQRQFINDVAHELRSP